MLVKDLDKGPAKVRPSLRFYASRFQFSYSAILTLTSTLGVPERRTIFWIYCSFFNNCFHQYQYRGVDDVIQWEDLSYGEF